MGKGRRKKIIHVLNNKMFSLKKGVINKSFLKLLTKVHHWQAW